MASKYQLQKVEERVTKMRKDNPTFPVDIIERAAISIRADAQKRMLALIPTRFKDAEITDAGVLTNEIQSAITDMFLPPPDGKVGLIFTGNAGSGKTYLSVAAMKWVAEIDPEKAIYFGFYPQIVQNLRTEFSEGSHNEIGSTWDILTNESGLFGGLVVIDDIASVKPSEFELEKLFSIIDRRANEFLPTILTMNIPPEKFEEVLGQRISSRLLGYFNVIPFPDHDHRDKN